MTQNEISYLNLRESNRHNEATEQEAHRTNVVHEALEKFDNESKRISAQAAKRTSKANKSQAATAKKQYKLNKKYTPKQLKVEQKKAKAALIAAGAQVRNAAANERKAQADLIKANAALISATADKTYKEAMAAAKGKELTLAGKQLKFDKVYKKGVLTNQARELLLKDKSINNDIKRTAQKYKIDKTKLKNDLKVAIKNLKFQGAKASMEANLKAMGYGTSVVNSLISSLTGAIPFGASSGSGKVGF